MWLLFALLAGVLYTGNALIVRHLLRGQKDVWAFSFYFSLIGATVSLPFMLAAPQIPTSWLPWLLAVLASCLIVAQNLLNFKSANYIGPSIAGAITKFRLVWVFALSIIILGTGFSWQKLLGTILTVAAGLVIIHHFKHPKSFAGVAYAFSATFLFAVVIIIYKYLFDWFNPVSLTFFVAFLLPAIINLIVMPRVKERATKIIKDSGRLVVLACVFGALANLAMNQALQMGEASGVLVTIEAFLVLTLVGEHVILKEKEQLWVKLAAVILAVAGAVLIQLSVS